MYEPSIIHFAEVAREKANAARLRPIGFFVGAMMAGAYIGIAMILALSAAATIPAAERPLVMGAVFGIGLILTVFAGAELFTGYVMYTGFGKARGTITNADVVRLLTMVWLGNLVGAIILVALFVAGGGAACSPAQPSCCMVTWRTKSIPAFWSYWPVERCATGWSAWLSGRLRASREMQPSVSCLPGR